MTQDHKGQVHLYNRPRGRCQAGRRKQSVSVWLWASRDRHGGAQLYAFCWPHLPNQCTLENNETLGDTHADIDGHLLNLHCKCVLRHIWSRSYLGRRATFRPRSRPAPDSPVANSYNQVHSSIHSRGSVHVKWWAANGGRDQKIDFFSQKFTICSIGPYEVKSQILLNLVEPFF